jgi:phage portal protein BeeE
MSPVDLNILDSNKELKNEFCALYGISPIIFDWTSNSTYNNLIEARKMSLLDGVIPYQEDFKDALNAKLVPYFGDDIVLDWDYQAYPEMQSDLKEQTERLSKSYWLTIDEKRAEQDFPTLDTENSQIPLVPSNLTRLDDVGMDSPIINTPNEPRI